MNGELNWWQTILFVVVVVGIMFMAVLWGTAPEQWYAGDSNYDGLVMEKVGK